MSSLNFGRSSSVGDLKPGETAVFDFGQRKGVGIAFGATRTDDGAELHNVIVVELVGSNHTRFGLVPKDSWVRTPAWVLPDACEMSVSFESRVFDNGDCGDAIWTHLHLTDGGDLLVPLCLERLGSVSHGGWLNLSTHTLQPSPSFFGSKLQTFGDWSVEIINGFRSTRLFHFVDPNQST